MRHVPFRIFQTPPEEFEFARHCLANSNRGRGNQGRSWEKAIFRASQPWNRHRSELNCANVIEPRNYAIAIHNCKVRSMAHPKPVCKSFEKRSRDSKTEKRNREIAGN
jgi:hypothetical protein